MHFSEENHQIVCRHNRVCSWLFRNALCSLHVDGIAHISRVLRIRRNCGCRWHRTGTGAHVCDKSAAFALGALTGGVLVWVIFDAFPSLDHPIWAEAPVILGYRLFPFWVVAIGIGTVVGLGTRRKYKEMISLVTAILGSWGISVGVKMIVSERNVEFSETAFMSVFFGLSLFSIGVQYYLEKRSKKEKGTQGCGSENK